MPDERMDYLKKIYKPKKTSYSHIEYMLPSNISGSSTGSGNEKGNAALNAVRACDGIIHVIKNFQLFGEPPSEPEKDFLDLESEMILNDLLLAEKRIEKINLELKKGRKIDAEELSLLKKSVEILLENKPLRNNTGITEAPQLKGFTFLSAKPLLIICNNSDENEELPSMPRIQTDIEVMVVRGKLEMEIGEMSPEDAKEFLEDFHIEESLLDRVIRRSFEIANLISFFTVGEDEVKSWTIPKGIIALDAADVIHSDISKGFIRAETLNYDQFVEYGTFAEAKKNGAFRLEGKEYIVRDGDIITFRFNV